MKKPALLTLFIVVGLMVTFANRSIAATPTITELGDDTYSCTRESTSTFGRDIEKLTAEAKEDVAKFCANKGKQPKVISITTHKPWMTLGIPKVTVVFKALEPGDPALLENAPVQITRVGQRKKKDETVAAPPPTNDLYADLLKLDDLRKKGILTEEEFQAEKQKVLNRSK